MPDYMIPLLIIKSNVLNLPNEIAEITVELCKNVNSNC